MRLAILVVLAVVVGAGAVGLKADAADWPQLRGPRLDGSSPERGLADRWPANGPRVLWTREIGDGFSSFAVVGDRAWTQTQRTYGQHVVCLDAATGREIWSYRYGWPYEAGGMYPGSRATSTVAGDRVYFAGPTGRVGCLRAHDGTKIWTRNVTVEFRGKGTEFGYAASPVFYAEKLLLPVGGLGASVVALDPHTGSTLWQAGDGAASYTGVLPVAYGGRRFVVAFLQNSLAGFDLSTGQLLWERVFSSGYDEHAAAPLYAEPYLMVAFPFREGAKTYRFAPGPSPSSVTPELVWEHKKMSNDVMSSVAVDGFIYGFDLRDVQAKPRRASRGEFRCLELATGKVRWSTDRVGHASVLAADGKLILFTDAGKLILARRSPDRYEELGRTQVFSGEISWTAPALSDGRLYLRSRRRVACVILRAGDARYNDRESETVRRVVASSAASPPPSPNEAAERRSAFGFDRDAMIEPNYAKILRWYLWSNCGLVIGAALAFAFRPFWRTRAPSPFLLPATAIVALAVLPWLARWAGTTVFVWPAILYVLLDLTVAAGESSRRRAVSSAGRWLARIPGIVLAVVAGAYVHAAAAVAVSNAWVFLVALVPLCPALVLARRHADGRYGVLCQAALTVLGFSLFYWGAVGML